MSPPPPSAASGDDDRIAISELENTWKFGGWNGGGGVRGGNSARYNTIKSTLQRELILVVWRSTIIAGDLQVRHLVMLWKLFLQQCVIQQEPNFSDMVYITHHVADDSNSIYIRCPDQPGLTIAKIILIWKSGSKCP